MRLVKTQQIGNCCQPNALMTLKEYLIDYAGPETRRRGEQMILDTIPLIPNEKARALTVQHLSDIENDQRDFRF
jgi:2-iminoacetate synthase